MEENTKNKTIISIALIIASLIIGGVSYYLYQNRESVETTGPKTREVSGEKDATEEENDIVTPTVTMPKPALEEDEIAVYFVDVENQRNIDETFGCGDSLSYLTQNLENEEITLEEKIESAVNFLITANDQYVGKGGLYNAFYQSNLSINRVEIEDSTANVYLTGELELAGTCDNPRIRAQLENTITQFDEIDDSEIYLNEVSLDLSLN